MYTFTTAHESGLSVAGDVDVAFGSSTLFLDLLFSTMGLSEGVEPRFGDTRGAGAGERFGSAPVEADSGAGEEIEPRPLTFGVMRVISIKHGSFRDCGDGERALCSLLTMFA